MPRRTISEFDDELLIRMANRTDITPAMRNRFIHDAYIWVCKTFIHPELQGVMDLVLAAGSVKFAPPAQNDMWFPDFVFDVTHQRALEPRDLQYIERQAKSLGNPSTYHWWGMEFYVDRIPPQPIDIRVFYVKDPGELFGSPPIDQSYDIIIIGKAAEIGFASVRDFEDAQAQKSLHNSQALEMKLAVREEHKNSEGLGVQVRFR